MNNFLFQPVNKFVKLSEFSNKLIKKCCFGDRVIDLLLHFPISVLNRTEDINNFSEKDKLTAIVRITDHIVPRYKTSPYKVIGLAKNGEIITIMYFNYNINFIRRSLPIDGIFTVSGNAQKTIDGVEIIHPDVIAAPNMLKYSVGTEPIYPLISKLSNRTLQYVISSLLKMLPTISDWIPKKFIDKYRLISFCDAIRRIHNPKNADDLSVSNIARKRIAIDELLSNQLRLKQIRESLNTQSVPTFHSTNSIIRNLNLPFELTADQLSSLDDIKKDLASSKPMNRLIQGDVGSGKTIVAFISMLIVLENNSQAALLAPTETLAMQHYNTIKKISANLGLSIDIMLSSNRKVRASQIDRLKSGTTQILIGTHAILEDNVEFKNLGLIVIDEQHRFGVLQRQSLIKKCCYPNMLAMSATPIPRTLLLGCCGDLDVSIIKTKPLGRKPIETIVINKSKIDDLIVRLKEINSQIYWVCPVIEESESLVDVNTRCEYLSNIFSEDGARILHGKMKQQEKEDIINQFKNKEFKLLVSTTVIEVGIDIPGANVIVIEHADRFGLAQLHQLRGRVGRGTESSYCILLYHYPVSSMAKQRMQLLRDTTDGFLLSEEDLKLRGAGDILGKEQSGFSTLKFSDFSSNYPLIQMAEDITKSIDIHSSEVRALFDIFNRLNEFCA